MDIKLPISYFLVGAPFIGLVFANGVKFSLITKKYKKLEFLLFVFLFYNQLFN